MYVKIATNHSSLGCKHPSGRDVKLCMYIHILCIHAGSDRDYQGNFHYDRVEVFVSGMWGTVSSEGWTTANSEVACRQAGYRPNGEGTKANFHV